MYRGPAHPQSGQGRPDPPRPGPAEDPAAADPRVTAGSHSRVPGTVAGGGEGPGAQAAMESRGPTA